MLGKLLGWISAGEGLMKAGNVGKKGFDFYRNNVDTQQIGNRKNRHRGNN